MTSSDAPAGDYGIGENDGEFSFLAYSAGTYHFTITAANGVSPDATQSFAITVTGGDTPLSDYQQWLQDHGIATDTSDAAVAPNGHTYGQNYIADIDPSSDDFLELDFATTVGNIEIKNASPNRYYELLVWTDLMAEPVVFDLGVGCDGMTEVFPVDDETFFARVRALLSAP